jgi:hypothetical protein
MSNRSSWMARSFLPLTSLLSGAAAGLDDPQTTVDPRQCRAAIEEHTQKPSLSEMRENADELATRTDVAVDLCKAAELYKKVGDAKAPGLYEQAIAASPAEPSYSLFYGDYLLNFRGPMQPLVGQAEAQLFEAARKLTCADPARTSDQYATLRDQLTRSIVTLHESDGVPLFSWMAEETPCRAKGPGVSVFLSVGVRGGEGITDLDVDSDIRALAAAAAYSQALRVNFGPLTTNQLEWFLRTVTPFENRNRLRARYRGARLDFFFNDHQVGNAAITNPILKDLTPFSNRDLVLYNALRLSEFGVTLERPFKLSHAFDADLSFTYSKIRRTGLVDYNPGALEDINQVVVKGVLSRFVGPDKVNGEFTFVDQSITPEGTSFQSRGRQMYAGTFRYQVYRLGSGAYSRFFQGTRGLEFYGGAMHDSETFGYTAPAIAIVKQQDVFGGATIHALARIVDLSVQPTWFTSTVPSDASRNNRQYRTAAYGMLRLVDEERKGLDLPADWHGFRLGFVHLAIPVQSDVPQQGISAFANQKVGAVLSAKWFTTERGGTTFLGSARYDVQRFTMLNRTFSLFTLGVTMGF